MIEVVHAIDGDKVMLSLPATSTISEAEGLESRKFFWRSIECGESAAIQLVT